MLSTIKLLKSELNDTLDAIARTELNKVIRSRKYTEAIAAACRTITRLLMQEQFINIQEEIEFFKVYKTGIYSQLYFHEELLELETHLHHMEDGDKKAFLHQKALEVMKQLTTQPNKELYMYYLSRATNRDTHYFSRTKFPKEKYSDLRNLTDWDNRITTGYDFAFAKVISYEHLGEYLRLELSRLQGHLAPASPDMYNTWPLRWTKSKTDLVEFAYFLKFTKAINHGELEITEIINMLSKFFDTDLSNFPHLIGDIRTRKKERLKLTEEAMQGFNHFLDTQERQAMKNR